MAAASAAASDNRSLDLFELCEVFASELRGPVVVEDANFRVKAYSSISGTGDQSRQWAVLHRSAPRRWRHWLAETGRLRRLRDTDDILTISAGQCVPGAEARLLTSIRVKDQFRGLIWVSAGDRGFAANAPTLVREFASLAAAGFADPDKDALRRHHRANQILADTIDGAASPKALLSAWNLDQDAHTILVAIAPTADRREDLGEVARLVAVYSNAVDTSAVATVASTVYLAVHGQSESDVSALVTSMSERLALTLGFRPLIALGGAGKCTELIRARAEVDRVLRVLRDRESRPNVATHASVLDQIALAELDDFLGEHSYLRQGELTAIIEHDQRSGTAYAITLRMYLEAFGDLRVAAEQLHVHPNSLRYRLRRISELFALDLSDPDKRLLLQLELRRLRPSPLISINRPVKATADPYESEGLVG